MEVVVVVARVTIVGGRSKVMDVITVVVVMEDTTDSVVEVVVSEVEVVVLVETRTSVVLEMTVSVVVVVSSGVGAVIVCVLEVGSTPKHEHALE